MQCSDLEAELRILHAMSYGILLSQKGKHKAIQHGKAVLIVYELEKNINIVKTVEKIDFTGFWNKEKRG